jgi:two-component system, LytTR family, response regulator
MNCLIVDDEPLAIKLLENHISKIGDFTLTATAKNAMEAYYVLQTKNIDLMFLDIQMPDLTGVEFLKSLSQRPQTVLTTAYREFALEGFELEVIDYLLKPITFERFFKAVTRILKNRTEQTNPEAIIIKANGFQHRIYPDEILYMESQGNDVKIVLKSLQSLITKKNLSEFEQSLKDQNFVRIHRSFIINTNYLSAFNLNEVIIGNFTIPVGRSYKKEFESIISKFER